MGPSGESPSRRKPHGHLLCAFNSVLPPETPSLATPFSPLLTFYSTRHRPSFVVLTPLCPRYFSFGTSVCDTSFQLTQSDWLLNGPPEEPTTFCYICHARFTLLSTSHCGRIRVALGQELPGAPAAVGKNKNNRAAANGCTRKKN